MSAVILRDDIVHYEVLGRGRPVIFLHDWVGSWRYWIPSMQVASISFRAYALDLWGFGDSAKNTPYYSIEGQTALLDDFLAEMGIGKIALIGHGLGAIIAMRYASLHPEFVDRVMAIALPFNENMVNPRFKSDSPPELADWLVGRSSVTEPAWTEVPKTDQNAILHSLVGLQAVDLPGLHSGLKSPFLLVHGQNDPAIETTGSQHISSLPDHAHNIIFEESGHFPMLEEPGKFNRLLTDFLTLPSGASPRQLQLKEEWKRRVR
jgi:pimeloyl-ACP methyl ester carboxylesterase